VVRARSEKIVPFAVQHQNKPVYYRLQHILLHCNKAVQPELQQAFCAALFKYQANGVCGRQHNLVFACLRGALLSIYRGGCGPAFLTGNGGCAAA
jgi:hypothetical protein